MTSTEQTLEQFRTLTDRFTQVVDAVADDRWTSASPCEGWTTTDVLDHVIDSQRDFLGRHELAVGEAPTGAPAVRWHAHQAAALNALGDGSVLAREFDSYFGPSTIGATLATFFGLDLVVHRWDLAQAAGVGTELREDELDHVEACLDELGDNIYAQGACGPAVAVGDDASRADRLIARTGRDPR
ncbi:TIGR03086 family metal-binding protein [Nocardioides sp. Bht2]|uniref:TIGR03086 family metal-binding protein n=1 Tax=Nocardioides sp. Bht2 TaxID=3392297 RepID=UPI0039B58B69